MAEQKQEQQAIVRIVLTANNHLGRDIAGQRRREERLLRLRNAFQQATSFAVAQGADMFIQAGDLFDTTTPNEQDRIFVASCLARLKQAGIPTIALGGTHDTPTPPSEESHPAFITSLPPAPQRSYAQLGALHYFSPLPDSEENEPLFLDIHGLRVGIAGTGWTRETSATSKDGNTSPSDNPFTRVRSDVERATIPLFILHAPIEGIATSLPHLVGRDKITLVTRDDIAHQTAFRVILDGYSHTYCRTHIGNTEIITAGSTQSDASGAGDTDNGVDEKTLSPGFVYLGLTPDGVLWCNHIPVDALLFRQLTISLSTLWSTPSETLDETKSPTALILDHLEPLCTPETMLRLRLEGEVTRSHYHQLDLNTIRHYGEQHCFSLAIDDSSVTLLPDHHDDRQSQTVQTTHSQERGERFSIREEVIALADRWIADAEQDEQERTILRYVKDDVLAAIDAITTQGVR